jgi:hypothetical protein
VANKIIIQPGQLYAVTTGTYKGSNLVVINNDTEFVNFLDLPDMVPRQISYIDVTKGIGNEILELLETLPQDIMDICTKQYEKNISNR